MFKPKMRYLACLCSLGFTILTSAVWAKTEVAAVSANSLATEAGLKILRSGGSAADAAVAMAFTLGVAEPYNSGIGGGGFLLYYDNERHQFSFVDYREAAPANAKNEVYAKTANLKDGKQSETGALAAAVPGFVAGMQVIHDRFGQKPFADLLNDAIALARSGYQPGALYLKKLKQEEARLKDQKAFQSFFVQPVLANDGLLRLNNLADTLEKIQAGGAETFYRGALSKVILQELNAAGSAITAEDFNYYHVYFRKPYDFLFKDLHIVSAPLPSTGGLFLEQALRAASENAVKSDAPEFTRLLMLQLKKYFDLRYTLSDTNDNVLGYTTHLCVVDARGNIAAMTNTINSAFGSGVVLPGTGILLNNEMDDFHFDAKTDSKNRITYRNRPLSSMSPTIIFRGLNPILVIGTPGGLSIPINLFQVLQRHLMENESLSEAIAAPKIYSFPHQGIAYFEKGFSKKNIPEGLMPKPVLSEKPIGNVQAIQINHGNLKTVSDPRGEGMGKVLALP